MPTLPDPDTPLSRRRQLAQALLTHHTDLLDTVLLHGALLDDVDRHELTRALSLLSTTIQRLVLREEGHEYRFPPGGDALNGEGKIDK